MFAKTYFEKSLHVTKLLPPETKTKHRFVIPCAHERDPNLSACLFPQLASKYSARQPPFWLELDAIFFFGSTSTPIFLLTVR